MNEQFLSMGVVTLANKLLRLLMVVAAPCVSAAAAMERAPDPYEARVLAAVSAIRSADLQRARELSIALINDYPNSRVGAALLGDTYIGTNAPLTGFASPLGISDPEKALGLQQELKARVKSGDVIPEGDLLPAPILDMGDSSHVMLGDMENSRLYVYQNLDNGPQLVAHYYMTIGLNGVGKQVEGDKRTPVGIYQITHFIDDKQLPDLYGSGAFPVDYPNVFDKGLKRTGYGIWLHGTPSDQYSRVPYASDGCFVVSNRDFEDIVQYIEPDASTPVILSDYVDWVSRSQLQVTRDRFMESLEAWELAWESRDVDRYARYYNAEKFRFSNTAYAQWVAGRGRVMRRAEFIRVDISVTGLYAYPAEQDTVLVLLEQAFESDTYKDITRKQMYWQRDKAGEWRIIYEGDA